jgi:membrane-anchored glycerophosphoryl diester phosphodiesterase (GDPDase)
VEHLVLVVLELHHQLQAPLSHEPVVVEVVALLVVLVVLAVVQMAQVLVQAPHLLELQIQAVEEAVATKHQPIVLVVQAAPVS